LYTGQQELRDFQDTPTAFTTGQQCYRTVLLWKPSVRCIIHRFLSSPTGQQKLHDLHENANWFRSELRKLGVEVLGDEDSPVMPVMLYNPAKIPAFSRECLKRNVRGRCPRS
jgi:7-keto-8-aminopelargonate synthetase-like enzyme